MGLDSFWKHPVEGTPDPEFDPPLALCGGMFSGNGRGSFRGKVYAEVIKDITGVSLYQEHIPNEAVREMAKALEEWTDGQDADYEDEEGLFDLSRMFNAYANAGFELIGWW